ncbi:MAG: baseplate J/gp47 family protein [Rikenellaceae bacterium]|jgi:hypothetical protein|nr:baseplate J/gp47 family protein [Rikenellaceae bacterium]
MAEKEFIPNDPEQILSDIIADYQQRAGMTLNPADPERIVIDCMAYREMILRGEMERLMRQNFVQYASGDDLDTWGQLFNVPRFEWEADDDYRLRILAATRGNAGTLEAYRQRILGVPGVADIRIVRKSDDNTLPPGVVRLIPIMKAGTDEAMHGEPHNADLELAIRESIYAGDFGIMGVTAVFQSAVKVPVSGGVSLRGILNFPRQMLLDNVNEKIGQYFNALSLSFDSEVGVYDLQRAILSAEGVLSGSVALSFVNVPVKQPGEFYVKGAVPITILS